MRSTVAMMVLAATQANQIETQVNNFMSRGNQKWNWNAYTYNDWDIEQEIDLNFDFGLRFDLPMGWDHDEQFYFN